METILSRPAKILSQSQREAYFSDGFIGVERLVDESWLRELQDVTAEFIDISRNIKDKDVIATNNILVIFFIIFPLLLFVLIIKTVLITIFRYQLLIF